MSQDETTASEIRDRKISFAQWQAELRRLTRVITANGRLHDLFHPSADRDLLSSTEEVSSLVVVDNLESKFSDVDVGIRDNTVASKVDETLDFLLLRS